MSRFHSLLIHSCLTQLVLAHPGPHWPVTSLHCSAHLLAASKYDQISSCLPKMTANLLQNLTFRLILLRQSSVHVFNRTSWFGYTTNMCSKFWSFHILSLNVPKSLTSTIANSPMLRDHNSFQIPLFIILAHTGLYHHLKYSLKICGFSNLLILWPMWSKQKLLIFQSTAPMIWRHFNAPFGKPHYYLIALFV